jgi:hypothetical protein
MSKQKIFLFTSDIASFIGQNIYDFVTPFERLWKRYDAESYNNLINTSKKNLLEIQTKLQTLQVERTTLKDDLDSKQITQRQYTLRINKIEKESVKVKDQYTELETKIDSIDLNQEQRLKKTIGEDNIKLVQSKTIETKDKRENITAVIEKLSISDDKKRILLKESESFINKTHGTLKEDSAIEMYEKRFGVKLNTSQEFFKKQLNIKSGAGTFDWFVGGRVDGLYIDETDSSKSYIVEVKNRTRGFFNTLRDYEKTQIHVYMYMLSIPMAKLVEKYENQIRITVIYQDDNYLNDILYYLDIFITNFDKKFLNDSTLKAKFVSSNAEEKKILLRRLYLNDITQATNTRLLADDSEDETCLINDDL